MKYLKHIGLYGYLCLMAIMSINPAISQDDKLAIVGLELPGLVEKDKTGAYANVINALIEDGLVDQWRTSPLRRGHNMLFSGAVGCIAPAEKKLIKEYKKDISDFVISKPFNKAVGYLYEAKDPLLIKGNKPLLGTVGLGVQYGIDHKKYQIVQIPNYQRLLSLLNANRLSAVYIVEPDIVEFPKAQKEIAKFKGTKRRVWVGEDSIVCQKKFESSVKLIDEKIMMWRKSGKLKQLLGKYFIE